MTTLPGTLRHSKAHRNQLRALEARAWWRYVVDFIPERGPHGGVLRHIPNSMDVHLIDLHTKDHGQRLQATIDCRGPLLLPTTAIVRARRRVPAPRVSPMTAPEDVTARRAFRYVHPSAPGGWLG
jgi:hypothetical protein